MTLLDLLTGQHALQVLNNTKLEATIAYRVGKAINIALSFAKSYEEKRVAYIKEHGTLLENNNTMQIPEDKMPAFTEWQINTQATEITADNLLKISSSDLAGVNIEPAVITALSGWFIGDLEAA